MSKNPEKKKPTLADEDEAYNAVFGGDFGALNIDSIIQSKSKGPERGEADGEIKHLPDAIDFEDEDELASEDDLPEEVISSNKKNVTEEEEEDDYDYMNMMAGAQMEDVPSSPKTTNNNLFDMNEDILHTNQEQQSELIDSVQQEAAISSKAQTLTNETRDTQKGLDSKTQIILSNGIATKASLKTAEQEAHTAKLQKLQEEERRMIKAYFPSLKRGKILKMTKLLPPRPQQHQWQMPLRPLKQLIPQVHFEVQVDTRASFNSSKSKKIKNRKNIIQVTDNDIEYLYNRDILSKKNVTSSESDDESTEHEELDTKEDTSAFETNLIAEDWNVENMINGAIEESQIMRNVKTDLIDDPADWNWNEDDLIHGNLKALSKPAISLNDDKLLLVEANIKRQLEKPSKVVKPAAKFKITEDLLKSRFNLSNDSNYDVLKQNYVTKIRSTISNLTINHSLPAVKLQSPFYKAILGKEQLRRFHSYPSFSHNIRADAAITFRKLKLRKRKRDRGKEVQEIFQKTTDLTVADTAPIFLMEHSERHPIAFSKFGMTSKLINYYRKLNDDDPTRPKLPAGETHVLGVQDKSPFWNFGFVEGGETVQTLYNNMIRAPIYSHDPSSSDFLLVKSTGAGQGHRFHLRSINNMFTVGQTLPCVEITGPNSRKVNLMNKNRLKMIAYRTLNKSPNDSLTIRDIKHHFPGQSDMHIRLKLKEFMRFHREKERDKDENGSWKLKENEAMLDFDTIRKMVNAEDVATQDSTYAAQTFLDDNKVYNMDEEKINLEEQLAPWNTTKNFLNATQMRAMVAIHGEGDPTGNGEGISFLKTSMKGGFSVNTLMGPGTPGTPSAGNKETSSHNYSVSQQQKMYEEEIRRTWYNQGKSLGDKTPFSEIGIDPSKPNESNRNVKNKRDDGKVLKITRKKRDQNGIIHRETVILRDPRVIHGYLKHYELSEKNLDTDILLGDNAKSFISGSTDEEKTKKLQTLLASKLSEASKKATTTSASPSVANSSASAVHNVSGSSFNTEPNPAISVPGVGVSTPVKNTSTATTTSNSGVKKPLGEPKTNRKCAACGAVGHIKTNKSCPGYKAQT